MALPSLADSIPVVLPAPKRRGGFIARYWRGEVPLGPSYWLVYVLLSIVIAETIATLQQRILAGTSYDPKLLFAVVVGGLVLSLTITAWQLVGLWRSARARRRERGAIGKWAIWAWLAQANVVLGVLGLAAVLAFSSAPAVRELYGMAFLADPSIPGYSFRTMRGGTEAEIVGGFKYGLTRDFTALMAQNPGLRTVHLASVGGRTGEARHLFRALKARGLDTYVAAGCYSACTMAFAAGAHRWLGPKGELGFHAPAFPGLASSGSKMADYEAAAFSAAGFAPAFVDRAIHTLPPALWKPTRQELVDAHVVTDFADADRFADSGAGLDFSQPTWDAKIKKVFPPLAVLARSRPEAFRAIASESVKAYRDGASAQAVGLVLGTGFRKMFSAMLAQADDDTLVAYAQLAVDEYTALGARSAEDCYLFGKGQVAGRDIMGELGPALQARDTALQERVVAVVTPRPATTPGEAHAVERRYLKLLARTTSKAELAAVAKPQTTGEGQALFCRGLATMFRTAAGMDRRNAGIVLANLLSGK